MKIKFTAEAMKKPKNMSTLAELAWNYFDFPCGTWCVAKANDTVIVTDESADFDSAVVFPDKDSFLDWLEHTAEANLCCVEDARSFLIAAGAIGEAIATDEVVQAVMDKLLPHEDEQPKPNIPDAEMPLPLENGYAGGDKRGGVDWRYYDAERFTEIDQKYLPRQGEGDTMATQICTAVNKLVYKWYNDGDVYDNQHGMDGWGNDLSSYANWLLAYTDTRVQAILERIYECYSDGVYEHILKDLSDYLLDEERLEIYAQREKSGSIYKCSGPFTFKEYGDDDNEWF